MLLQAVNTANDLPTPGNTDPVTAYNNSSNDLPSHCHYQVVIRVQIFIAILIIVVVVTDSLTIALSFVDITNGFVFCQLLVVHLPAQRLDVGLAARLLEVPERSRRPPPCHWQRSTTPLGVRSNIMSTSMPSAGSLWKNEESQYGNNKLSSPGLYKPDPRASSSQSLRSTVSDSDQRRTLLIIYIHGFYGNDQSFRSFPYHVHSYLRSALKESHVIHSKIYPRYKTYRAIEVARDNFSEWLVPHEGRDVDTILVGHSMGGILAAEVALMQNRSPYQSHPFKHRILGTISLDSPFLGLHPGIIVAGISSLFQPSPSPPTENQSQGSSSTTNDSDQLPQISRPARQQTDPFFNPPFWNDNPFKEAPFFKRISNFAAKHRSEGIFNATRKHVLSHLEYGGCLADFPGLHQRYEKIRALEDVDEFGNKSQSQANTSARVRFVNYYTISTGRDKKQHQRSISQTPSSMNLASQSDVTSIRSSKSVIDVSSDISPQEGEPPTTDSSSASVPLEDKNHHPDSTHSTPAGSIIIPETDPIQPSSSNTLSHDPDTESLFTDMERLSTQTTDPTTPTSPEGQKQKPKKKKKFCTTPRKQNGMMDKAWVEVFMEGVDEVGAHCGLFFSGLHYDRLVGDVGSRIIGWVQDDMTKRMVLELNREF